MTRFSVIIPTCNRPLFLTEATASVLAQLDVSLELIVVNDGEMLARLPDDPRIHCLDNARRGAVAARNLGLAAARGEFIAWLDDDDHWNDPRHLALAAAAMDAGADFTFADGVMLYEDGTPSRPFAQHATRDSLAHDNTILVSAVCYSRRLHQRLGLFDPALPYYWDWDWYLRVALSGAVLQHIAAPVVAIRVHPANMSGDTRRDARFANLAVLAAKHGLGPLQLKNHADFV